MFFIMAALTWILTFICVAGVHLTSASPVPQPPLVVEAGQNVSLACNLTSASEVTWYLLRSEQLLPLMTVQCTKFGVETVDFHTLDISRFDRVGALESGTVGLQILQVEEEDAGLYFCVGKCSEAAACVSRIQLAVGGVDEGTAGRPCLHLSVCVLLAVLLLCVVIMFGFYLSSGKPAVCCCGSVQSDMGLKVTEDESLHYSSLKHTDKLRPRGHRGTGSVEDAVLYSTVKHLNASRSR